MTRENLVPPFRFALLAASPHPPTSNSSSSTSTSALYRGSLPLPHHVPFLESLNLKTIISLTPKPSTKYEEDRVASPFKRRKIDIARGEIEEELVSHWCERKGIKMIHIKSDKSKDGSLPFNATTVKKILELLIQEENLPIYIHDLDGSDVLGIIGAALRKLMNWNEASYTDELSRFLRIPPAEPAHLTFIRKLFNPSSSSMISNSLSPIATSTQSHPNLPSSHSNLTGTNSNNITSSNTIVEDPQSYISIPNSKKRARWFYSNGIPNSTTSNSNSSNNNGLIASSSNSNPTPKPVFLVLGGMKVKLEPEELFLPSTNPTSSSSPSLTSIPLNSISTSLSDSQNSKPQSLKLNHKRNQYIVSSSSNSTAFSSSSILPVVELIDKRSWSGGDENQSNSTVTNFVEGGVLNGLLRRESLAAGGEEVGMNENLEGEVARTGVEKLKVVGGEVEIGDGGEEDVEDENENEDEDEDEEDEEDEEEEEEEVIPLSQMIDALDLGL